MNTIEDLDNIITLKDERGCDTPFEFLDLIEYNKAEYIVLLPTDLPEDEPGEVVILRLEKSDDEEEETYVGVEDQGELDAVFKIFRDKFKDEFSFSC